MRPLPLILLACLLSGCASPPADHQPAPTPAKQPVRETSPPTPELSANLHQLSGALLTPAPGSVVELAVVLVDAQGHPRELLTSLTLSGTGQALPFALSVAMDAAPTDLRLQLRARVSVSGRLVQRLPGQFIRPELNSDLGALQLVAAP